MSADCKLVGENSDGPYVSGRSTIGPLGILRGQVLEGADNLLIQAGICCFEMVFVMAMSEPEIAKLDGALGQR